MEKVTASLKSCQRPSESPPMQRPGNAASARPLDAELFPKLSKIMANMSNGPTNKSNGVDAGDDYPMHGDEHNGHLNGGDRKMHDIDTQAMNVERIARDWGVDSIDDVNAATAMLALKHGPKVFAETFHAG